MKVVETVPPSKQWATLQEAKQHLREPSAINENDVKIESLIGVVYDAAVKLTNRAILTSTWMYYLNDFPSVTAELCLPRGKVQSVSSVKYINSAGTLTTISASDYETDLISVPANIRPVYGGMWPTAKEAYNAVQVEYVAGWTSRDDMPQQLREAMFMHLNHLYEIRSPVVVGTVFSRIPDTMHALYAPYRIRRFP
jgi:uncharacterized phiE125 gp8 family phage protein